MPILCRGDMEENTPRGSLRPLEQCLWDTGELWEIPKSIGYHLYNPSHVCLVMETPWESSFWSPCGPNSPRVSRCFHCTWDDEKSSCQLKEKQRKPLEHCPIGLCKYLAFSQDGSKKEPWNILKPLDVSLNLYYIVNQTQTGATVSLNSNRNVSSIHPLQQYISSSRRCYRVQCCQAPISKYLLNCSGCIWVGHFLSIRGHLRSTECPFCLSQDHRFPNYSSSERVNE
jgi:hypothetical protein